VNAAPKRPRGDRYRWTILAAGVVAQASFSALFLGLSALAPAIQRKYDLSLTDVGVVLAAVNIGLVFTLLPWGLLADRIGERAVVGIGLTGAAAAVCGAAFAGSFTGLVGTLVLAGALGGCVQSASGRAVMTWFGPGERGLALGIRQTAVPLGGAVGAVALPAIAEGPGLRAAFLALAVTLEAAALVGVALLREGAADDLAGRVVRPLRDRGLWLLCGASTLYLATQFSIVGFVVLFLHGERGFSTTAAAGVLAATQVCGAAARIALGRWSDRLGTRIALLRSVGLGLAAATALAAALIGAPDAVLVPAFVVAGTLGLSWNGLSYTAAAERAGRAQSGAALGFQQTLLAAGSVVTPIAFAAVVGATSWRTGFALSAVCPLVGYFALQPLAER
jgi:sugar phosphate permease